MSIQLTKEVSSLQAVEFAPPNGKTAYSFKLDVATGGFQVVRNSGGSEVKLPELSIINIEDYQATVWSDKLLNFSWSSANPGHLNCEIV